MNHRYLENVTTISYNSDKCVGCGRCMEVCPHSVFDMDEDTELRSAEVRIVDKNSCMECGACAMNCPEKAIKVNAGVGCASAIIKSWFTGKEPTCGCSGEDKCC